MKALLIEEVNVFSNQQHLQRVRIHLTGIPGTLGGAIAMNAGTLLGSISDIVFKVEAIDLNAGLVLTFSNSECNFRYRDSVFRRNPLIVTSAELLLSNGDKEKIQKKINDILKKRIDSQPLDKPNAGSIFKNPDGYSGRD